jgi:hypothetical protein
MDRRGGAAKRGLGQRPPCRPLSGRSLTRARPMRSVATGHGLTGGVSRCYNFFVDFSECMAKAGDPVE